ncbi:MAG: DUF4340 domain-containing protein [Pseudomonadota bacterium]
MNANAFVTLALITTAAVGLAVATSAYSGVSDAIADRGEAVAPGLRNQAQGVTRIEVDAGDGPMVFERKDGAFRDISGFPAKPSVARELIAGLAVMTIEERRTDDPKRYAELDLAKPGLAGGGDGITLKGASGNVIADVVVGDRDATVGGTRGGQFVRRGGEPQTYLARGSITPPVSRAEWFETSLANIKPAELAVVFATAEGENRFSFTRSATGLTLADLPPGRAVDPAKVQQLERLIAPLRFADVRAAEKDAAAPKVPVLTARTADGLTLQIALVDPVKPDQPTDVRWVRVSAEAAKDNEAAQKRAQAINARTGGFAFKLTADDTRLLSYNVADFLTQDEAAPQNSSPSNAATPPTAPATPSAQ